MLKLETYIMQGGIVKKAHWSIAFIAVGVVWRRDEVVAQFVRVGELSATYGAATVGMYGIAMLQRMD